MTGATGSTRTNNPNAGFNPEHRQQGGSEGVLGTVTEKARDVASTVSDYAGQAREKVQDWTSSAGETLSQASHTAQDWASDAAHWTGEHATDFGRDVTQMIRRYPVPALLIGFGFGFLLARLSSKS
jgi:hypothetical protein